MTLDEKTTARSGWSWFISYLTAALVAAGCGSDAIDADNNDGLTVDPTSVPCQDSAGSDEVCIPGGEFIMGHKAIPYTPPPCPPGDVCGPGNPPPTDYAPAHIVKLSSFFIDRYPATNGEYKECYDAGMCPGDCIMLKNCFGIMYDEYRFTDPFVASYPVATIMNEQADIHVSTWK